MSDVSESSSEREELTRIIMKVRYRDGRPPAWVVREAQAMADQILDAGFRNAA